jgi:hypothetical protein
MKQILILVIGVLLIAISCAKKEVPSIKISPAKWNETDKYRILVDTTQSGSYVLIYKSGAEPTMELCVITEITEQNSITRDSTLMILNQENLKPVSSSKVILMRGTTMSAEVKYRKNKASIKAQLPQGEKSADIPIRINTYDNDEVTTLLRAVELKPLEEKEISVVVGLSGTSIPIKIKTLGVDKTTVPSGEFLCNKYEITLAGHRIEVWYEESGMKRMIKYFDNQANMTMELLP